MGIYSDYLEQNLSFSELTAKRKEQLEKISQLRDNRDVVVYASDLNTKVNAPISIDYSDILPFQDQISNLNGKSIDIIIETPGGIAEVAEDLIKLLRSKYDHIGVIIPGTAKSAGTIFSMAADEILMGTTSSLGPIDAQIMSNNKRFSADAFLEGLEKIKKEVTKVGRLNPAYIPILQNISPGEIQHCENAQNFSKKLVTEWLTQYKFKYWDTHSSTGEKVTDEEKKKKAREIANELCKHSNWLTHGRSIQIPELTKMGLRISDYTKDEKLNEAITRYYTLLKMSLDSTNMYKIIETSKTQVMRFAADNTIPQNSIKNKQAAIIEFEFKCSKCMTPHRLHAKLDSSATLPTGALQYPAKDLFICPNCQNNNNLAPIRLQIEAQTGKKIVH